MLLAVAERELKFKQIHIIRKRQANQENTDGTTRDENTTKPNIQVRWKYAQNNQLVVCEYFPNLSEAEEPTLRTKIGTKCTVAVFFTFWNRCTQKK